MMAQGSAVNVPAPVWVASVSSSKAGRGHFQTSRATASNPTADNLCQVCGESPGLEALLLTPGLHTGQLDRTSLPELPHTYVQPPPPPARRSQAKPAMSIANVWRKVQVVITFILACSCFQKCIMYDL